MNLNDIRKSIGTCIEVYEAYKSDIPVIGFLDEELPVEAMVNLIHPWIYCCIDRNVYDYKTINKYVPFYYEEYGNYGLVLKEIWGKIDKELKKLGIKEEGKNNGNKSKETERECKNSNKRKHRSRRI